MDARAEPNIQNREGRTACFIAAQQGHAHVLKLLKSTASVHIADFKEGCTPLHAAALRGHHECVIELVSARANVSVLNRESKTALQVAEEHNNSDVAAVLRDVLQRDIAHDASCS